jgi:Ni,Fe-hydrogenase III small subunit
MHEMKLAAELDEKLKRLFGRSLKLRQVSAGGCNGCEMDVNVLNTVGWDLSRFGIQFVASPRHADGLLITGAVSENMTLALKKTYDAVPSPKIVIAVGACAISGGPVRRARRGPKWRRRGCTRRPVHSRLLAASAHDSGRTASSDRQD